MVLLYPLSNLITVFSYLGYNSILRSLCQANFYATRIIFEIVVSWTVNLYELQFYILADKLLHPQFPHLRICFANVVLVLLIVEDKTNILLQIFFYALIIYIIIWAPYRIIKANKTLQFPYSLVHKYLFHNPYYF